MIKLAHPYIPEEAIEKVIEVLKSGNLVQGKFVAEFEEKLRDYLGVKYVVAVSSGTAALHLSLIALGISEGDEVIVPAFTFPATANVVEIVGAKPVFVDINLDDFCIDTTQIEDVITKKTKAIIPVHEFGQAAKMDDIMSIAAKNDLKVIEDAACGLGAEFNGQKVGTFGEFGCFSFHPRKAITTGEGGAIVTNDVVLAKKVMALRNHGIEITNGKIELNYAGYNYRMTDFQAALGLPQMKHLEAELRKRVELAKEYNKQLFDIEWIKTPKEFCNRRMVYQTYHILVDEKIDRDALLEYLRENNIEVNYGAQALNCLNYYSEKYELTTDCNPKATNAFYKGIALPFGGDVCAKDIERIHNVIKNWNYTE